MTWVKDYLTLTYGEAGAQVILDDIDNRIAAVAPFSYLRRFPDGRGFKQWTGDDSKALMKVQVIIFPAADYIFAKCSYTGLHTSN